MITVKKDAVKIKTSEGMQSAGVLANVGVVDVALLENYRKVFMNIEGANIYDEKLTTLNVSIFSYYKDEGILELPNFTNFKSETTEGFRHSFWKIIKLPKLETLTQYLFSSCLRAEEIYCPNLRIVPKSNGNDFPQLFYYTQNLVELTLKSIETNCNLVQSSKLSDRSIQHIIDILIDLTGSESKTLTLQANVKAKLTDEQIATITSKNWTLA